MNMETRKDTVRKIAARFVRNLENMSGYDKQVYMEKLVNMLDETHLIALDFAVEMTPQKDEK